jgi:AmpE protein
VNLLAILFALALTRLAPPQGPRHVPAALVAYVRAVLRAVARRPRAAAVVATLGALAPGLAVAVASELLGAILHGALYLTVAVVVLYLSLGPRDLKVEVGDYCAAAAQGGAAAASAAAEILESDAGQRRGPGLASVGEAVFVQANNRLFGVLFWFALLGPLGALSFRVTDLMRREALARAARSDAPAEAAAVRSLCQRLHGVLAFVPARLLALTYGVAGSFEESFSGWRRYLAAESDHFFDANDRLLVHAGRGALGAGWDGADGEPGRARAALALVEASLFVWLVVLALLTLVAWLA